MIPQSNVIWLGVDKVQTFSHVTSYTSLCLLNLRASIDFQREKPVKEKLNTQTAPHLHLLFLFSASLGGCWRAESEPKVSKPTANVFTRD